MVHPPCVALIASADAVATVLFETVLEAHGFEVLVVTDGFEAADAALARRPALIVLDRLLPGLDARSVCRLLKARRATDRIPLLVITPLDSRVEREDILGAGADQVLVEPCAPELLALEAERLVTDAERVRAAEETRGSNRRANDARHVEQRSGSR